MSVLRRNMFRGGGYAHRGTGITTGLNTPKRGYVDGPGSYAGVDDTKQKFEDYMELFDEMGLSKEKKPFNKLAAASPALLALGEKLLSSKSYQGGWGGGLDILGQAAGAAAPGVAQAIQARREHEALDPNANLKNMALQMALKETDPDEVKDSEMVYGEFGTGENKVTGYGFATTMKSGERSYEIGGQKFNAFKGLAEPEENKPEKYFKADLVKVRKVGDTTGTLQSAYFQSGDKGSERLRLVGQANDLNADEWEIVDTSQTGPKQYEDENYDVIINGQEYKTLGNQRGQETFIIVPPGLPDAGQLKNINEIAGFEGATKAKVSPYQSLSDSISAMKAETEFKAKLEIATDGFGKITDAGDTASVQFANYQKSRAIVDQATTSSFAKQRSGFLKFLETAKINEWAPGAYSTIQTALDAGDTVATEFLNANAQQAFIANAQAYDDRLNNTEVKKLAEADFSISMSPEGQKLLMDVNMAQAQIKMDGAKMARLLAKDSPIGVQRAIAEFPDLTEEILKPYLNENGTMSMIDAVTLADEYMMSKFQEFGNSDEIKQRIDSVLGINKVGDAAYFDNLEDKQLPNGHNFDPGKAYLNKQIKFLGYPVNGEFTFGDKTYSQETGAMLDDKKPVYLYTYEKKPVFGEATMVRVPIQF